MLRSIWMNAWDLDGEDPATLVGRLKGLGLNGCNLGLSYHGGRQLLPRSRRHRIYEQDPGALYFPAELSRYADLPFQPQVSPLAVLVPPFLEACRAAGLEVNAWTVLCHNDRLGTQSPESCVRNVFGERYTYALCPSNPAVRRYVVALTSEIAAMEGIARLDLEALSFLGCEHMSLHDKRGVPLGPAQQWLLSICACDWCGVLLGEAAAEIAALARAALDRYLEQWPDAPRAGDLREDLERALGAERLGHLLAARRCTALRLLEEVRSATPGAHLNLRLAPSPFFCGGKSALDWSDLPGRADSATVTFFGASIETMAAELARLPPPATRPVPAYGGFVIHQPDCASEAGLAARLRLLRNARLDGWLFYSFSLAASAHLKWLHRALLEEQELCET